MLKTCFRIAFLSTNVLFAHVPETSVWEARRKAVGSKPIQFAQLTSLPIPLYQSSPVHNPDWNLALNKTPDFKGLPLQYGMLRDVYMGTSGKNVLLIQDVHLNLEAQQNTFGILSQLAEQKQLGLVAVEGAFGKFNFKPFHDVADGSVLKDVANAFLKTNRIGAPSYLGLTSTDKNISMVGIDDFEMYQKNVKAYTSSHPRQALMEKVLAGRSEKIAIQKKAIFNPNLKHVDSIVQSYESGQIGMGDFVSKIKAHSPEINKFLQAYGLENTINFNQVSVERKEVLDLLLPKLSPSDVDQLMTVSMAAKAGGIRYGDYYRYLTSLVSRKGVSLKTKNEFLSYLKYTALCDEINSDRLFREVQTARINVLKKATQTKAEQELLSASRSLFLQKNLTTFSMTPDEWLEYKKSSKESGLANFEAFYEAAHERSGKMVENLLRATQQQVKGTTVLIVGGFHSPEITHLLKEKGIGYAVMSPNITTVENDNGSS